MDESTNHKFLILVKILRLAVVCGSMFGLIFYVNESYEKLKVTPEVLVNEKFINSRAVPFPAVTLCSPQLVKRDYDEGFKMKDEVGRNLLMDDDDLIKMTSLGNLCKDAFNDVMKAPRNMSYEFNEAQVLNKISPDIDDTLQTCVIEGYFECNNMMIRSLTDYGYCFSFNMLGHHSIFNEGISKDFDCYKRRNVTKFWDYLSPVKFHDDENKPEPSNWTLESGYSTNLDAVQPLRATRSQFFMTELKNDKNMTFCSSRGSSIYVILHLPNEIPTIIQEVHIHDLKTFNLININAEIKQHDETLKNFDLAERGCFFEGEKQLRLFKSYSKFNCEYECMINFTQEICGCVKFSMPRTDDMKVCKLNKINCYDVVARDWPKFYYKYRGMQQKHPDFPCDCMPSCTGINYNIMKKSSQEQKLQSNDYIHSAITIVFDSSQIIRRTNYVTYKLQNFVADIGGLIGLFLGFSLLSLFELMVKGSIYLCRLGKRIKCKLLEQVRKIGNSHEVITVLPQRTNSIGIQSDPIDIDICENHDNRPNSTSILVEEG